MANKRDTSKQKRARQNRAEREARKARTVAASVPAEQRRTKATATPAPVKGAKKRRERAPRPPRPGDVPVDIATLKGNWFTKRMEVPGGRQVLYSLALTVIVAVLLATQKYATQAELDKDKDAKRTHSIFEVFGARAWIILLVPVIILGVAAALSLHPKRRGIWIACTVALGLVVVSTGLTLHLVVIAFLIYGIQRANKIEGPVPGSWAARRLPAADDADADAADAPDEG